MLNVGGLAAMAASELRGRVAARPLQGSEDLYKAFLK